MEIDPKLQAQYAASAKKQLRKRMRALRSGHSPDALSRRSDSICARLLSLPLVHDARAIALFWPLLDRGEVDLRKLDRELRNLGIAVYYPFMDRGPNENHLTGFRKTDTAMDLVDRGNGFSEPVSGQPAQRGEIDIVVVPALAADVTGRRIGYGAGYYDATLGDVCPPAQSILVAYQFQMLAELPQEKHDQKCDLIVTDDNLYQPEASAHKDAEPRDMGH